MTDGNNQSARRHVQFSLVVANLEDRDEDMIAVPRWMLAILGEELGGLTGCGTDLDEPGCPRCDAIVAARHAAQLGLDVREAGDARE